MNPVVYFQRCNSKTNNPIGYVSIGPDIGLALTQIQVNEIQKKYINMPDLMGSLEDFASDCISEQLALDLDLMLDGAPEPLFSDNNVNITLYKSTKTVNDSAIKQLTYSASTLIERRVIDYFIVDNQGKESLTIKEATKTLHDNALKVRYVNR